MAQAEDYQRLVEFLRQNAGRQVHVEIGQPAQDLPDYDDIIATLDGRLGEPQSYEHPERGNTVGYVQLGEENGVGGRFVFEERRLERVDQHGPAVKAWFGDFYIAVAA